MDALRTLYLLRHAQPQMPGGVRCCLGQHTDPPLAPEGEAAARELAEFFAGREITAVGTSPLLRCRQTAELLFPAIPAEVLPGMIELDGGAWEGLSFAQIRARYPEIYARRGTDASVPPPGGETMAHGAVRGVAALEEFFSRTEGNVAVIGHSGIDRAVVCALAGVPFSENRTLPMHYLQIHLLYRENGVLTVVPWEKGSITP